MPNCLTADQMIISYGSVESNQVSVSRSSIKNGNIRQCYRILATAIFIATLAFGLVLLAGNEGSPSLSNFKNTDSLSSVSNLLFVSSVSDSYGIRNTTNIPPYAFLVDSILVEPYKETIIRLADPIFGCSYVWYFNDTSGFAIVNGRSTDGNIAVTLKKAGKYTLFVSEKCDDVLDSSSSRRLDMNVWVKYVRRELSSLNEEDRENFLDAFYTLWTVSTTEGKKLYGDRYKSVHYFATLHNDAGGNAVCDEFHGGLGFLNNHMYLSAYIEQSLQLVNPKVALHYLEYNKYFESASYTNHMKFQMDGGKWTQILTSKFFGANDPLTGEIIDGRWKSQTIPYVTKEFLILEGIDPMHTFFPSDESIWLTKENAHLSSPYGLLRSPWNYNPSPVLTRYGSVFGINDTTIIGANRDVIFKYHMGVRCADYQEFFDNVKGQPLESYLRQIEDNTHGIFHFTYGGVGGANAQRAINTLVNDYNFSYSNVAALAISAQPFFKKYLAVNKQTPINCTAKPWSNYTAHTTALPGDGGDGPSCDFADSFYEDDASITQLTEYFFYTDPDHDDPVRERLMSLNSVRQKEAFKIIGGMFPYDGDLAGSGADMIYSTVDHCEGHSAQSFKSWLKGYYFEDESVDTSTLTNAELIGILDPSTDKYRDYLNFVYDTFSFDWCSSSDTWFTK